jgi:hypothetical protein
MVMRHFGGGIGHLQSQKGEVNLETDSVSSSEDGELNFSSGTVDTLDEGGDTEDMESSDDDLMESGMISSAGEDIPMIMVMIHCRINVQCRNK